MSSFKKNAWIQKTAPQLIPSFPAPIRKKLNHALRIPMRDTPDLDLLKPFSYLLSSSDPIDVATSIDIITALDSTNHLPHHNQGHLSTQTYLLGQIYLNLKIEQLLGLRENIVADDLPQPSSTCGSQLIYPTGPFPRNSPSNSTPNNFTFISYGSKTLLRSGYSHTLQILNLSPCVPKLWGNCFRGSRQTLLRTEINLGPLFDHIPANLDLFTDLLEILHKYPGEFVLLELDVTPFLTKLQNQDKGSFLLENYHHLVISFLTNVQLVLMHIRKTSTPRIIILGQSLIMDSAVPSVLSR